MRTSVLALLMTLALNASLLAQQRDQHIGYVYPAGAQRGTSVKVIVGGQFIKDTSEVYVSGTHVSARVLGQYRAPKVVYGDQREELVKQLVAAREARMAELKSNAKLPSFPGERYQPRARQRPKETDKRAKEADGKEKEQDATRPDLPEHPLISEIEKKSLAELYHVADLFLDLQDNRKKQPNTQLTELAYIEVTVEPNAAPGIRELRLKTTRGLTNSVRFCVGTLPEVIEAEPNDPGEHIDIPGTQPPRPPVVFNGQIMPGDVDRLRFKATAGQQLVIQTDARRLVPFLSDAVPGWFQATLAVYDAKGNELAFADDFRFDPDPVLLFRAPADGLYEVEIRDSIYRGREDFTYRVTVGERPFITHIFPLGGRSDTKTTAMISGWNLPADKMELDTTAAYPAILTATVGGSNNVLYAVDDLPEVTEREPNNDAAHAQWIALPLIVNGRMDRAGDADTFAFKGRAGDKVAIDVIARRLRSPLDSLIRLKDASGKVLVWNDDATRQDPGYVHPDMGVQTHHADSALTATLPENGTYTVSITDAQTHGGEAYAYRMRISAPRVDFDLRMAPSELNVRPGGIEVVKVYAMRRDGLRYPIDIALAESPAGLKLSGATIPASCDSISLTVTMPQDAAEGTQPIRLEGTAALDGATVRRRVLPCEDVMQAFLWRHLLPAQELLLTTARGRSIAAHAKVEQAMPLRLDATGTTDVTVSGVRIWGSPKLELHVREPLAGLTISNTKVLPGKLAFSLKCDGGAAKPGLEGNVLIEMITEYEMRRRDAKATAPAQKRRVSLGYLPAIPFQVLQQ